MQFLLDFFLFTGCKDDNAEITFTKQSKSRVSMTQVICDKETNIEYLVFNGGITVRYGKHGEIKKCSGNSF